MESPQPTNPMLPKKILVRLDGSNGSARALDWAIALAKALDAEIVAAHVVQVLSPTALGLGLAPSSFRTTGWTMCGGASKTNGRPRSRNPVFDIGRCSRLTRRRRPRR